MIDNAYITDHCNDWAKYKSKFEPKKRHSISCPDDQLWGVFAEDFAENLQCYSNTTLQPSFHMLVHPNLLVFIFFTQLKRIACYPDIHQWDYNPGSLLSGQETATHLRIGHPQKKSPGPWFNIKMTSYQYRKSHYGDKTILRLSHLHNGISYTGKMSSLYWIGPLVPDLEMSCRDFPRMKGYWYNSPSSGYQSDSPCQAIRSDMESHPGGRPLLGPHSVYRVTCPLAIGLVFPPTYETLLNILMA